MPIVSRAQQGYMFANHPRIAKKMADRMKAKGMSLKGLPKRIRPKRTTSRRKR